VSERGVYLDSSAIAKLVLDEAESDALRTFLSGQPSRATSVVSTVEVRRSILRRQGEAAATVATVFDGLAIVELDADVAARAGVLPPAQLRSLDAIPLATALLLASELDAFVTYDHRLADAARAVGLAVASPGTAGPSGSFRGT